MVPLPDPELNVNVFPDLETPEPAKVIAPVAPLIDSTKLPPPPGISEIFWST